jgi:hypothetical protein
MKNASKARKYLRSALAVVVLATGYFASVGASQAGWIYTKHGYVFCKIQYSVQWCN